MADPAETDETPLLEEPAPERATDPDAEAAGAATPVSIPATGDTPRLRDMRRTRERPPG